MKDKEDIQTEIVRLTAYMETNYPELYRHLDENPMAIPSSSHPDVGIAAFRDYLDELKKLPIHYLQTHKTERL